MESMSFRVDRRLVALLAGLGLLGAALVLVANRGGVGVNLDSAAYLLSARSLLAGRGLDSFAMYGSIEALTEPLVHWPPLFPLALGGLGLFGLDPAEGARLLNAFLFAVNIGLAGWLAGRLSGSRLAAVAAAVLVLGAPHVMVLHGMAWSEPLFLTLTLGTLALVARYLVGGRRWLLYAAGLAAAAACLTRYVGLTLVLAGAMGLLLWPGRKLLQRMWDVGLYSAIGVLPTGLWMLRNLALTGRTSGRTLVFHPPGLIDLKGAVFTALTWLAPRELVSTHWPWLLVGLALGVLLLLGLAWRSRRAWQASLADWRLQEVWPLVLMLVAFGLLYFQFTLLSITFFDAYTPLDARILAPVYVVAMIAAVGVLGRWLAQPVRPADSRRARLVVAALLVALAGSYSLRGLDWASRNAASGEDLGASGQTWRESTLMALIEQLPPETPLATNRQDVVYVLTNRLTYRLPLRLNPTTELRNPAYEHELRALGDLLADGFGAVVYFQPETNAYMPPLAHLSAYWNICRVETAVDGFIYYLCPPEGS